MPQLLSATSILLCANMSSDSPTPARRRLLLGRTLSSLSQTSLASIRTILPEYSIAPSEEDNERDETPTLSDLSPVESNYVLDPPESPQAPSPTTSNHRQSVMPPRYSVVTASPKCGAMNHIEHSFPHGGGHKTWATLYTFTKEFVPGLVQEHRVVKRNTPRFFGGGDITGVVELNLEGTQTIQQIILTVCPKISDQNACSC